MPLKLKPPRLPLARLTLARVNAARVTQLLFIFLALAFSAFSIRPAAALSREGVSAALRSTVQVIVPDNDFEMFSLGSGTIMDDSGLILTNYHVVEGEASNGFMNDSALVGIAVTPPDLRGEAVLKYFGLVVKSDPELDLALIQIVSLADDPEAALPENLGLPAIAIGNSDDLMISDEVNMFGFPGLGGNTPTYTKGIVSGFLDEDRNGIYEWIKTDAELNYGNSGGLATDEQGRFIGVPSAGNTDDIGKIGLVRTGNLALDFVNSYFPAPVGDGPNVNNVRFAEVINRRGEAVNPAVQFASGLTDLYAVFDFANFEDGLDLTYVWYLDGFEIARDSFQWDVGESGSSWVSLYDEVGLQDGLTELELIFDGVSVYRGGVMIGEANAVDPINTGEASVGEITFAEDVSGDQPVGVSNTFAGVKTVYAFFDYEGMTNGVEWIPRWSWDGEVILDEAFVWDGGASGSYWTTVTHPDGLPAGTFALEIVVDGEVLQSASFDVQEGGTPQPTEITLIGSVVDRNNSRTDISGALIALLNPGTTVEDWVEAEFADSMVHGSATSNGRGEFQLDNTVVPGEFYSVIVVHDDYEPIAVDDFQIPPDATDPYELEVTMDRS